MSKEIGHPDYEELLGAYALDAVEPDEAAAVEEHLAGCPRCRGEVDAYRELAACLGTSALLEEPEPPSPAVWRRIASSVASGPLPRTVMPSAAMPDATTAMRDARTAISGATTAMPGDATGAATIVPIAPPGKSIRHRSARWAAMAMAAAAIVAIVVLGLNLSTVDSQLGSARQAIAKGGTAAAVQAALAEPNHRLVRLDSSEGTQVAEFVVTSNGNGYLVHSSMAPLPADETYQLWAIVSGQAISIGLMGSDPVSASFTLAPSASAGEIAVTVEPAGGVTTPDRAPVASGRLA